ncbi:hypothetical protein [Salinibacter ruber]|uniref:Uncharacterized protein n=1 Tax=Salinibacter ruber TaxID=146919 RepID=A0AAW5P6T0_9BACT|nr:hypothetical protein [Salinibacter ruber]MCS4157633.1 hypothetical protein [Salinibacter ruber]
MPPNSIEQNQADFSGRYTPIDSPQYQQVQAQAYYERMRAHVNERSQSLMSGGQGRITTGRESARGLVTGGMYDPSRRSYRSRSRQQRADAQDITERAMQLPMNAFDAFNILGSMTLVENPIEEGVGNMLYRGSGTGGTLGFFGSSAAGFTAGAVGGTAAIAASEGALRYTGTRDAFNQFEDIRDLQQVSRPMTAGTASGPRGRMSREMAQEVTADMAEQGRLSTMMADGESFSEMQEQAGILADYKLMEGVRDADEFERKFSELKEGVKRVMEVLGTTFEEGASLLSDFRNVGITPGTGVDLLDQARMTSAQFGTNFRQTHAAGMKSAMAMQGTGMSMAAGYQMGQQAQGMAQTIYEGRYLDENTIYNMGGQQGIRMNLQRGQMRFMEGPSFTAMMMGASRDGQFDGQNILQTLAGERTPQQNANAAGQSIDSLEDVYSYRDNSREAISSLIEDNPAIMQGLQVRTVMQQARAAGMNPEEMTRGELGQFAADATPMNAQEFEAAAAAVESLPETYGRRAQEERRTAESRADDRYTTGPLEQTMEGLRELPLFRGAVSESADIARRTRDAVYNMSTAISQEVNETFTGQKTVTVSGGTQRFFSQEALAGMSQEARQRMGVNEEGEVTGENVATYYEDEGSDLFGSTEAADVVEERARSDEDFNPMKVSQNTFERRDGRVTLSPDQISQLESQSDQVNGLGELGEPVRGGEGRSFSYQELASAGVTASEADMGPTAQDVMSDFSLMRPGQNSMALEKATVNALDPASDDAVYLMNPEQTGQVQSTGKAAAQLMDEALSRAPERFSDLSTQESESGESARDVYMDVKDRMQQVSESRRNRILNTSGGNAAREVRKLQRDVLQEGLDIDPDLEGEALDKAISEKLSNIEGGKGAVGKVFKDATGQQLSSLIQRYGPEYGTLSEISPSEQENIMDQRTEMIDENLEAMGEGGTFYDTEEADYLQEMESEVMIMAHAKSIGRENLSDAQLDALEKAENTIASRAPDAMDEAKKLTSRLANQSTQQELVNQARVAQSDLAGSGSDEQASGTGAQVQTASSDQEARDMIKNKMIQLAQVIEELQSNQKEIIDLADPGSGSKGGTGGGTGRGSAGGALGLGIID